MDNHLKTVGAISSMFSLMSNSEDKGVDQRARFYATIHGISFPRLARASVEEKIARIDALDKLALEEVSMIIGIDHELRFHLILSGKKLRKIMEKSIGRENF